MMFDVSLSYTQEKRACMMGGLDMIDMICMICMIATRNNDDEEKDGKGDGGSDRGPVGRWRKGGRGRRRDVLDVFI